jgi:lysozyme
MSQIKIPNLSRREIQKIIEHHKKHYSVAGNVFVVGIRGYFLDSIGLANRNDLNVWDDVLAYWSPRDNGAFAGNTDPSFVIQKGRELAKLNLGVYQFQTGHHKKIPKAFRAYPEGVKLPCTRNGKPSFCSYINIHPGGIGTWSEGCQTLPPSNWAKFQPEVYAELDFYKQKIFNYLLIENREIGGKQNFYDAAGRVIAL